MSSSVWLVILNWNGKEDTLELLESLKLEPATILVVDNGSRDGTLEAVRASFPGVRTLQTGANLGYAGGNNVGLMYALAEGAEIVGVLNNDTLVEAGFLTPLLTALLADSDRAVSPDIRLASAPRVSWFRGGIIDRRLGVPVHLGDYHQPPIDVGPVSSDLLTGCCLLATAGTWRRVGLFDEAYFLIFEDSDWSMRARNLGIDLRVVPASRIRHKVSRSFVGSADLLGVYYYSRNGLIFASRYLGFRAAARFLVLKIGRQSLSDLRRRETRRRSVMALVGTFAWVFAHRGPAGRLAVRLSR